MTVLVHEDLHGRRSRATDRTPLREQLGLPQLPSDVVGAYRPRAIALTRRIVARIKDEVAGFSAEADPLVRQGVDEAIQRAVDLFVDTIAGAPTHGGEVFTFYRWVGSYQASAGLNLDAMRAAQQIATEESWADVRLAATVLGQSAEVVSALGSGLIAYQARLFENGMRGYVQARARMRQERDDDRAALLVALLRGSSREQLRELAGRCSWALPPEVLVAVTVASQDGVAVAASSPSALSGVQHGRLIVVADPDAARTATDSLVGATGECVAVSWPMPVDDAHLACRWASRGLSLVQEGVIESPADGVVEVERHQELLCTHADTALRRLADERALAPLLRQTPKRRLALAETLLLWLQTHQSAPMLAAELGVHDQTVRHRLRRLRDLFGPRLDEPGQTATLLNALESSIPRWRRTT